MGPLPAVLEALLLALVLVSLAPRLVQYSCQYLGFEVGSGAVEICLVIAGVALLHCGRSQRSYDHKDALVEPLQRKRRFVRRRLFFLFRRLLLARDNPSTTTKTSTDGQICPWMI